MRFLFLHFCLIFTSFDVINSQTIFTYDTLCVFPGYFAESNSNVISLEQKALRKNICKFMKINERQYKSLNEVEYRAKVLSENEYLASLLTSTDPSATYSALKSPFGDLTLQEFKDTILFSSSPLYDIEASLYEYSDPNEHPSSPKRRFRTIEDEDEETFDWVEKGKLTEVKNQGSLGTCWAFSAVTVVESQVAIKEGKKLDLSVEQLVECANDSNASSGEADCAEFGGWPYLGFEYIKDFGGIYSEKDFPYCSGSSSKKSSSFPFGPEPDCFPCMPKAYDKLHCGDHSDLYCNASGTRGQGEEQLCKTPGDKDLVQIKSWRKLSQDEDALKDVLMKEGPISVALNAILLQFYFGGVISIPFCSSKASALDHAVVLVGFGSKESFITGKKVPFWKVRNSWGKSWGEEGYFRLKRGIGMCGINLRASIAHV